MRSPPSKVVSLLLPYYLEKIFSLVFEELGLKVFWSDDRETTKHLILDNEPDLAIEWQHGVLDYPIRDLLRKHGRQTPVVLALNYQYRENVDQEKEGIAGLADIPFIIEDLMKQFFTSFRTTEDPLSLKALENTLPARKRETAPQSIAPFRRSGRIEA